MSDDFLNISVETAAQAAETNNSSNGSSRKTDDRFWKPNIKNERKEYQAKIRLLPRGLEGVTNGLHPTIEQHVHYIREPNHGLYLTVKCRKALGKHEHCPICDANWAMYNTKVESLVKKAKSRMGRVSHIGNILIREDLNHPEFNGQVKLWDHTNNINKMLLAPLRNEEEASGGGFKKKQEKFNPYSPINGRDFITIVSENPDNGFPNYNGSFWDEAGLTDIAPTKDEIMATLDQCYDLNEFINDIPTVEELTNRYNEFSAKLAEKENSNTERDAVTTSTSVYMGGNNPAASQANVSQGNSESYFSESAQQPKNELDMNSSTQVPVTQATPEPAFTPPVAPAPMLTDDSDDDDELPF